MLGLFNRKTDVEKLQDKYKKLLEESHKLSHTNRAASDKKVVEAEEVYALIESLQHRPSAK